MQLADAEENFVIFNTVPSDTKISLGLSNENDKPKGVSNHKFRGIVGKIKFDDHSIPLWNFLTDSGDCKGYYESLVFSVAFLSELLLGTIPFWRYTDEPTDPSYLFADGYVQIPAVKPYRAGQTQLWLTFATYSENGLLYFRGNPVMIK